MIDQEGLANSKSETGKTCSKMITARRHFKS